MFGAVIHAMHYLIDVKVAEIHFGNETGAQSTMEACFLEKRVYELGVIAVTDECVVYDIDVLEGTSAGKPFNGGTITVDDPTTGAITLPPAVDPEHCQKIFLDDSPSFSAGETITAKGTGGADLPPFSLQVTAPNSVALTLPSGFQPGEAITLSWRR